jgi:hypothetical protein
VLLVTLRCEAPNASITKEIEQAPVGTVAALVRLLNHEKSKVRLCAACLLHDFIYETTNTCMRDDLWRLPILPAAVSLLRREAVGAVVISAAHYLACDIIGVCVQKDATAARTFLQLAVSAPGTLEAFGRTLLHGFDPDGNGDGAGPLAACTLFKMVAAAAAMQQPALVARIGRAAGMVPALAKALLRVCDSRPGSNGPMDMAPWPLAMTLCSLICQPGGDGAAALAATRAAAPGLSDALERRLERSATAADATADAGTMSLDQDPERGVAHLLQLLRREPAGAAEGGGVDVEEGAAVPAPEGAQGSP